MKDQAYTLVEVLIVCLVIPSLLTLIVLCLNIMKNIDLNLVNQADIFDVQIVQFLARSKIDTCDMELRFSKNNEIYSIYLDNSRIVKSPGYEILLFGVDDLYFESYDNRCFINYRYLEKMRRISVEID